jgi:hypothetical protein
MGHAVMYINGKACNIEAQWNVHVYNEISNNVRTDSGNIDELVFVFISTQQVSGRAQGWWEMLQRRDELHLATGRTTRRDKGRVVQEC